MANVLVEETSLSNIASAIREKNGGSATYKPGELAAAISNLPTGGSSSDNVELKIGEGLVRRYIQEDSEESSGIPETYVNTTWEAIGDYAFSNMRFKKSQFSYRPHTYEMLHTTFSNVATIGNSAFSNVSFFSEGYYRPYQDNKYAIWDFPKVTKMWSYAFSNTQGINTLNFPILTSVEENTFSNTNIVNLNIPNLESCYKGFISNSNVKTLSFPKLSNVRGSGNSLGQNLEKLTTLELGLTNNSYFWLVSNAPNLTKVTLPQFNYVSNAMFKNCSNIKTIVLSNPSNVCTLSNASYLPTQITNTADTTSYIYVPQALLTNYKTATNWATFSSKIRAIEDYPDITGG